MIQLSQINKAVQGQMVGADVAISGVTIDSREDCSKKLFIGINGDRFDGHDFFAQAVHAGATALLSERSSDLKQPLGDVPVVVVEDSLRALSAMAAWWRSQFDIPIVGVTGSVGKTTVKEMIGSIFSACGPALITSGNLNNEIGMPLTLMRLHKTHRAAVIEMGMNHAGEISRLTQVCKPTVALINNAAAAHLEGLGSVAAVADAKGEIFQGLADDGVAIINADDQYATRWEELAGNRKIIRFGISKKADVSADYELSVDSINLRIHYADEMLETTMPLQGLHNVSNVLASVAVAYACGIEKQKIAAGLLAYRPANGRLNLLECGDLSVFDDTYNANPASMKAAIDVLSRYQSTVLIVGEMGELGSISDQSHRELGALAASKKINRMLACGKSAKLSISQFGEGARAFDSQQALLDYLALNPITKGVVLVKGSRSAAMELVVAQLSNNKSGCTQPQNNERGDL